MQPELNNTKIIFLHSAAWTAKCSTCLHIHIFCMNVLFKMSTMFKMSTIRHQHLFLSGHLHSSQTFPQPGICTITPEGDTSRWSFLSHWPVLCWNHNHAIATRRPGPRWAYHYPRHNANITPVFLLYICTQGASSGARVVSLFLDVFITQWKGCSWD